MEFKDLEMESNGSQIDLEMNRARGQIALRNSESFVVFALDTYEEDPAKGEKPETADMIVGGLHGGPIELAKTRKMLVNFIGRLDEQVARFVEMGAGLTPEEIAKTTENGTAEQKLEMFKKLALSRAHMDQLLKMVERGIIPSAGDSDDAEEDDDGEGWKNG